MNKDDIKIPPSEIPCDGSASLGFIDEMKEKVWQTYNLFLDGKHDEAFNSMKESGFLSNAVYRLLSFNEKVRFQNLCKLRKLDLLRSKPIPKVKPL